MAFYEVNENDNTDSQQTGKCEMVVKLWNCEWHAWNETWKQWKAICEQWKAIASATLPPQWHNEVNSQWDVINTQMQDASIHMHFFNKMVRHTL